ncbi:hypothetical protein [Paenibacillus glacialis]|uniref:Uncharacterized protein n=1 Tax=Paenibacillus glacialis TaxID=494026 RepID=A0A168MBX2_9BACL|nr:hypothetical protein [Paenibacillus glacialis]OAB44490.1 hypothetical protein PGLA_07490 [Paenibacillus glacialis]
MNRELTIEKHFWTDDEIARVNPDGTVFKEMHDFKIKVQTEVERMLEELKAVENNLIIENKKLDYWINKYNEFNANCLDLEMADMRKRMKIAESEANHWRLAVENMFYGAELSGTRYEYLKEYANEIQEMKGRERKLKEAISEAMDATLDEVEFAFQRIIDERYAHRSVR